MKKTIAAIAALMISVTGYSQGTFLFNNRDTGNGIDAKITDAVSGAGISTGFTAQMWLINGTSTTPLLPTTTFRTGNAAGYVTAPADPLSVPGVAGGANATLRMVAFNGSDFNSSTVRGMSAPFTIALGGGGSPPSTPSPLIGLTSFTVAIVPEPATIALGILGLGALLIRRKK